MISIRTQALNSLAAKHETNQKIVELMFDKAMSHKDVEKLYLNCRTLQLEIAKLNYAGKDVKSATAKLNKTKQELYALLEKYGIDRQTLKVKYNCPKCKDKGVVDGVDCDCLKAEISNLLLDKSGLSKDSLPSFDDVYFKIFGEHEATAKKIYEVLRNYCNNLEQSSKKVVTLMGDVGVGKTHLLECVVNECISNNKYVIYTTAYNLNNDMLKYHTTPVNEKSDILQKYIDCDLLCIDDLGCETILKNVTNEYLYQIINERLQLGKSIVITTNLTPNQVIETYDERIFSRITNQNTCLLLKMEGSDLRRKKL